MVRSRSISWRLALAATVSLGALTAAGRSARADEEPEALIKQGVEMRKNGDNLKAHGYFQRAYEIARTPRSAAQLGLSDLSVDQDLDAEHHLTEALASTDPWIAKNRDLLEKSRQTARGHLGQVVVSHAPVDTTVEVAGRPAIPLPRESTIWVPPGGADLRFEAPGRKPFTASVTVAAGASTTLEVSLAPVLVESASGSTETGPGAPPPAPVLATSPPEAPARPWQTTAAWVTAGVGVAALAAGITGQVLYASKINAFNAVTDAPAATSPNGKCDKAFVNDGGPQCHTLLDEANTRLTLAVVGYAAAGVALGGSLVLALTAPSAHGGGSDKMAACLPLDRGGLSCLLSVKF